ncbi:MAG: MBL fold metallo-hydrolase [Deltaproteobacteria bacterium]|nr:MBL fold metallo-hydrolase [Deltaproteobacteria bacterium]
MEDGKAMILDLKSFGKNPSGEHLEKIKKSPQYSLDLSRFVNRQVGFNTDPLSNPNKKKIFWDFFFKNQDRRPKFKLPQIKTSVQDFLDDRDSFKFIWFGHSTFMVKLGKKVLLFDPVFAKNLAPLFFLGRRFQDPVLSLQELPPVDYIVISHDHYDHLNRESVIFFKDQATKFLVPLGVSSHLIDWGIPAHRITEFDWWESAFFEDLEFTCTPSQHFSGRSLTSSNQTLWASWVVKNSQHSLYFSGDSGYDIHFKHIGKKYGPFDIAFMENGQYNPMWRRVHMLPEDTMQAFLDLEAKRLMPIHWGMFNIALHPWYDPIESIQGLAALHNIELLTPKLGQLVQLNRTNTFEAWWKDLF